MKQNSPIIVTKSSKPFLKWNVVKLKTIITGKCTLLGDLRWKTNVSLSVKADGHVPFSPVLKCVAIKT